ncbi:uncharacterized protein LOC128680843 isoform X2 [Plodia interpunctella]|uniref:uncharacterized protein LOC128680843 isoform X2 n=1 Tax=Plodia interpunctella TaxID=58824 RepID=UPI00236742A0|nr:uncharacterized protein LOC128680843 isoform X2 [Plodia interpunctella]
MDTKETSYTIHANEVAGISWSFRSFMKKGKRQQPQEKEKSNNQVNGDKLVEYRNALQYSSNSLSPQSRNTVGSPERTDRYVYGGSVTPLPRSRFQERLRSPSNYEIGSLNATPRMARSEISGSRNSVGSTNPFDEDEPIAPVRAPRRKKKRAAPLPPVVSGADIADDTVKTDASELESSSLNASQNTDFNNTRTTDLETQISSLNATKVNNPDDSKLSNMEDEEEDLNCNIELKIVEDNDDDVQTRRDAVKTDIPKEDLDMDNVVEHRNDDKELSLKIEESSTTPNTVKSTGSEDDILDKVSFSKVDITTYRRNSSVNDDDIRLRRGNLEDFHALSNKRSKSLTNTMDDSYVAYDINLNEDKIKDANDNDAPQKVVCKVFEDAGAKQSIETVSSTENEFIEIDRATRELEREISKLNSALVEDDLTSDVSCRGSVTDMKRIFEKNQPSSPNPIPKPRRSHHGDISTLAINGNS